MRMFVVADEISSDFETTVELGVSWGIRNLEIRGLDVHRIGNTWSYLKH